MSQEDPSQLDEIEARLDRIEKKLGQSQAGGGGIGCLGFVLFVWVILQLAEILERLPA